MNYILAEVSSYSIALSGIVGLVRFRKIDKAYYPFIYLLWAGLLNEVASTICIKKFNTNVVPSNIYSLIESLLIAWFFYNMRLFDTRKKMAILVMAGYLVLWVTLTWIYSIFIFCSYYNIVYSFFTVLMSIHMINRQLLYEDDKLLKNPVFLISISFIAFFSLGVIIEIFWLYGVSGNSEFEVAIYRVITYVNLIVNLIFVFAVIWIPRKQDYILP